MTAMIRRAAVVLTVLGLFASTIPAAAVAQQRPLRIGLLIPTSGVFAAPGKYMQEGLELYLNQHGNMLGGRRVEVIVADDQGNPAVGITKTRELVEQDHIDLLYGPLSAAVGVAIVPYIDQHKVPTIFPIVSADDLSQRTPSPYIARTGWTSSQPTQVLAITRTRRCTFGGWRRSRTTSTSAGKASGDSSLRSRPTAERSSSRSGRRS